jgi:methanogenic corrinoid protein MtbC1
MIYLGNMNTDNQQRHPIQVAARRSGLTPDVIRVWERRYEAVRPVRTSTNRRLYSDEDVERLFLLGQVTRAGRRIGDVAHLSLAELKEIATEDREAAARVVGSMPARREDPASRNYLNACIEAIRQLDGSALERALSDASVDLSPPDLMDRLLLPLLNEVGDRWRHGTMRVAHEHMASALIRSFLGALKDRQRAPLGAPEIIVATPAGQRHEFGALMVSVAAASDGWKVTYLGADLPVEDIAAAARERRVRAVALSLVYPADDPKVGDQMRTLREYLQEDCALFVGGAAAPAYENEIGEAGGAFMPDLATLRTELEALRYDASPS